MPRLPITLNLLCVAGPTPVPETVKSGEKVVNGEVKAVYKETGKTLYRFHFTLGAESVRFDADKQDTFQVGKNYKADGEEWFKFFSLQNFVISEARK